MQVGTPIAVVLDVTRLILLLVLLFPFPAEISPDPDQPSNDEHPCLAYDTEVVHLSGTLERRAFPGPPGYGEDPSVNKPETACILKLLIPICTRGSEGLWPSESAVREVQVVAPGELLHALAAIEGRPVMMTGTLFHSHSGHHHTSVLILLQDLSSGDPGGPESRNHGPVLLVRRRDEPPAAPLNLLS